MAFSEIYVDPSIAADSGRGTRATITLTAATFTTGTWNLNEASAFTGYTYAAGDQIYISGGTAVTTGLYTIASKTDNDNIVLSGDITTDASSPTDVTSDSAPYGDLEYAVEQTTFDTTNGTRVNIKTGSTETLAASLDVAMADTGTTIAWAPTLGADCVFQGYTAAAGDGGVGVISGGGSITICDGNLNNVHFIDMHLTNSGTAQMLDMGQQGSLIRCEIDTTSFAGTTVDTTNYYLVMGCYIHTITGTGGAGIYGATGLVAMNNIVDLSGQAAFGGTCINIFGAATTVIQRNILICGGEVNSQGINCSASHAVIMNNSIYSTAGGSNSGIIINTGTRSNMVISNNLVEGFSDTGGEGIENKNAQNLIVMHGNGVYNCATPYTNAAGEIIKGTGWADATDTNETLTASPFTSAATGDFTPVDTDGVKEGSVPEIVGI